MKKGVGSVLFLVLCSFRVYALGCNTCCSTPSDTLFCISSTDGVTCPGGCDCCPEDGKIHQNPTTEQYLCCSKETPYFYETYTLTATEGSGTYVSQGYSCQKCPEGQVYASADLGCVACKGTVSGGSTGSCCTTVQTLTGSPWSKPLEVESYQMCCSGGGSAYTGYCLYEGDGTDVIAGCCPYGKQGVCDSSAGVMKCCSNGLKHCCYGDFNGNVVVDEWICAEDTCNWADNIMDCPT